VGSDSMTEPCPYCGSDTADPDSTCPKSIPCPTCRAKSGRRCKRPSGHPAQRLHAARIEAAEADDRARGVSWTLADGGGQMQMVIA